MVCSRCASPAPIVSSVELRRRAHTQLQLLCAWCSAEVERVLATPASLDYDDLDLLHTDDCKCDACDPDFHMELRRDHQAA